MSKTGNQKDYFIDMAEAEIELEAKKELTKPMLEFVKDSIREANTSRKKPATEEQNLDIIKHLIKILAIHQVVLEKRTSDTNRLLLFLTFITTIAALPAIMSIVTKLFSLLNNLK